MANKRDSKYNDEKEDRDFLRALYDFNESYREAANDFAVLRGVQLQPSMVRMLINGYQPGKTIRETLNWPPLAEVPVCPVHNEPHCYDCETEQVKPRRNGTAPAPKRTPPIRIGEATDEELEAIKTYLTTDERREALVEAANNKRRS